MKDRQFKQVAGKKGQKDRILEEEMNKKKEEEDQNKLLENNQLIRPISSSLTYKVEELVKLFRKEQKVKRPYCNEVIIKVSDSDMLQSTKKKKTYKEQSFRITIDTSFEMLRDMACEFWAMNQNEFSLYDH